MATVAWTHSSSSEDKFTCSYCHLYSARNIESILRHVGAIHSHDPNFNIRCGIDSCTMSYQNYASFRRHLKRKHPSLAGCRREESRSTSPEDTMDLGDDPPLGNNCDATDACSLRQRAMFVLKTREVHKVSSQALSDIMTDFTVMMEGILDDVHDKVEATLRTNNIPDIGLKEMFHFKDPFQDFQSEYLCTKYFREHFMLIEPISTVLGSEFVRQSKKMKLKNEEMYYVPLLMSLEQLLNNKFIHDEVENGHQQSGHILRDFCDGSTYRNHSLFRSCPNALQIILYYDDVEVCNPLGSKAKVHKLGLFYYVLGNIRPQFRSCLKSIQLLCTVKVSYIQKYGINDILQPFMDDIKLLERDEGVKMVIDGQEKTYRGTIVLGSADNLASQLIGGYKSLASAVRKCRFCLAVNDDMVSKFRADQFQARTRETHASHIANLNGPLQKHMATTYGICFESVLNSSRFFHVTEGLVMDIMHDILEGVLQYESKELLKYLISRKDRCSLSMINRRINMFPYGYSDVSNKPSEISSDHLASSDHKLRQNASQMWCLGRLLPLLIGSYVPIGIDRRWECYLLLMTIVDYVFAPMTSIDVLDYVEELIENHHSSFKELYPTSPIIPKIHYMIHIPHWIRKCGPVSQLWCMRFEAKHSYFKSLAHRVKNFRNIPKTLAVRHQKLMCYYLQHPDGCSKSTKSGKGILTTLDEYVYGLNVKYMFPTISMSAEVESVKWTDVNGTMYRCGAVVITDNGVVPSFAKIVNIFFLCPDSTCFFVCEKYEIDCFNSHYHSYEVISSKEIVIIKQSDLIDHHVLHDYRITFDCIFIPMKYHILENL